MNRKQLFKQVLCLTMGALLATGAQAAQSGRKAYEEGFQEFRAQMNFMFNRDCEEALQQPWGQFSGNVDEYRALEKKYLDGASLAAVCAIKYGHIHYLWLGDLQTVHADPKFAKLPLQMQTREANRLFGRRKVSELDAFIDKVNCNAHTPRISSSGYFTQTVSVECSTPFGPAVVDLASMHVTINGKDFWNGRNDTYFGRNFYRITGSRP